MYRWQIWSSIGVFAAYTGTSLPETNKATAAKKPNHTFPQLPPLQAVAKRDNRSFSFRARGNQRREGQDAPGEGIQVLQEIL
jgi:hypothetical protein